MILPATYVAALLLTILSMVCWGSWANTFKLAGKWRFEVFYYDYAAGVLLTALVAGYTLGSLGSDVPFADNLAFAGKRNMAYAVAAGTIFNLANMLLVAAISVAGMAVAFPVGIGLALVVGVVLNYSLNPQGNAMLIASGVALVVAAIVADAFAYTAHSKSQARAKSERTSGGAKGIFLSLASGLLMGSFYPLVEMSKGRGFDAGGLAPYAIAVLFGAGVFVSTFIFNLYFLRRPVQGPPLPMSTYFQGTRAQHLLGLLGGLVWCAGAIANFAAASAPKSIQVGPAVSYAMGQGATMISALWGLLVWKEFQGARASVKVLLAIMLVLFVAGLVLVSIAPLYAS